MRKHIAAACAAMLVVSPAHPITNSGDESDIPPSDYTMQTVNIVGRMQDTGWMFLSNSSVPNIGLFSSFRGNDGYEYFLTMLEQLQLAPPATGKVKDPSTDTRILCAVPGREWMAKTVSTDTAEARGDAVRTMVGAQSTLWAAKAGKGLFNGGFIGKAPKIQATFTFADGGTEDYYIFPGVSDNSSAVPGSLKKGDGIPKAADC
jgi:hypothetical protein